MPKRGSGSVLSFTSAATTVVGTLTACHPLVENSGVEMTSPLASTLADVCSVHPSCRASFVSSVRLACVGFWARRDETGKNWTRTNRVTASRLAEFIVLPVNDFRARKQGIEDNLAEAENVPENG